MWPTPTQAAMAATLILAYILVTRINAEGSRATRLLRRHAAAARTITAGRRDFEKDHHLVLTPTTGTSVVLIEDSHYMREYHGAVAGQLGTVIEPSRLSPDDTGVLVDWGVRPNDMVRMDLSELKLAPHA